MIVGLDFSLTGTGMCVIEDGEAECLTVGTKPVENWWTFADRPRTIARALADMVDHTNEIPGWAIESPSFMSKGRGHDLVLVGWWLLVDEMTGVYGWEPPLRVTPGQLKKFATGNGNASKTDVVLAVERKYPDAHISGEDEADAVILAAIGAAAYGEPFGSLTKVQSEVVAAVVAGKER